MEKVGEVNSKNEVSNRKRPRYNKKNWYDQRDSQKTWLKIKTMKSMVGYSSNFLAKSLILNTFICLKETNVLI